MGSFNFPLLGGVALLILGVFLPSCSIDDMKMAGKARAPATEMRYDEFRARGPAENRYVTLRGVAPGGYAVFGDPKSDRWQSIMVAVGPEPDSSDEYPEASSVRVLLRSGRIHSESELASEFADGRITGLFTRQGMSKDTTIESVYPGVPWKEVWVMQHERTPPEGFGSGIGMLLLGCLLLTAASLLIFLGTRSPVHPGELAGLVVTGPVVWVIVGLFMLLRGKRIAPAPVLAGSLLAAAAVVGTLGAILLVREVTYDDINVFLPLISIDLACVIAGVGIYYLLADVFDRWALVAPAPAMPGIPAGGLTAGGVPVVGFGGSPGNGPGALPTMQVPGMQSSTPARGNLLGPAMLAAALFVMLATAAAAVAADWGDSLPVLLAVGFGSGMLLLVAGIYLFLEKPSA